MSHICVWEQGSVDIRCAALFAGGVVSSAFEVAGDPRKAGEWSSIWVG